MLLSLLLQDAPPRPPGDIGRLEFALGLVDALIWPVVVAVVAVCFRKEIGALAAGVKRIRMGELEADIERVRDEAAATVEQLRDLALVLTAPVASTLAPQTSPPSDYSASLLSPSTAEAVTNANEIKHALIRLGADPQKADSVAWSTLRGVLREGHTDWIRHEILESMTEDEDDSAKKTEARRATRSVKEALDAGGSTADARRDVETLCGRVPPEVEGRILDLEHFDETSALRRTEIAPWNQA